MLRSIIINQLVVGYSIWILNGDGRQLLAATQFDPVSLGVGVVGGAIRDSVLSDDADVNGGFPAVQL